MYTDAEAARAQAKFAEGLALHQQGQLDRAQAFYKQALTLQGDHHEALHLLGLAAAQSGNHARALDLISQSIAIHPDNAAAHANLGNALAALGRSQAAVESYNQALRLKPDYAQIHLGLCKSLYALRQHEAVVQSCNRAIALMPGAIEAYFFRGLALFDLKRYQEALASYDQLLAIKADSAEAYYNRGNVLHQLKQYQAAIKSFDRVLAAMPGAADAYYNRGLAFREIGQHEAAIDDFEKVFALNPEHVYLIGWLLYTRRCICDWRDETTQVKQLVQKVRLNQQATNPFTFLALCPSLAAQRQAAQTWVRDKHPVNEELGPIVKRARDKKIRLGYYSADFHNHATAYLMAELFELHDKDRFELFAFSFGPDKHDEMRKRISVAFDNFIDVRDQSDKEVALLSRNLGIDIAIDLKGFTQDDRFGIFSYRAAPLQVSYLGYPGTVGAPYMDYLIADKTLIPLESQQHYAEKIVYLPHSYQVNDRNRKISEKTFSREELGLPETGFVYCCFNNNYKITPETFAIWMRILGQVQGSVLWLLEDNQAAAANLRKEAQNAGISPNRLVFAKRLPLPEHLARQRVADLFLDTLPYNAHTTASDALWAGLPVLTCTGEAFASRVAASLLNAIELPELVTHTKEDYETLAVELAVDPEKLKAIRHKLQHNRLTRPLFNTKSFTRYIENAYTRMMKRYQADLPPDQFYPEP